MRLIDVEALTGMPYDESSFDCADFVVHVQRALFRREVMLPNGRPRGTRGQAALGELSKPYGVRTDAPVDGDLVLMFERGRPAHVGVYFWLAHEAWVLHSCERIGESVLHRVRDLPDFGAPIEGFYRWLD
ncbi:C40 family peptidase [Luteimonas fraxinea]|uniref:C40 family peptidase n=1 Tax=Luteimonas fraxinea TaxID=2901869 RepID=A0ABS8UAY6_9GAMM|nr:C40 family peptidase [Luteimonas fraxinea]MCD9096209.1 C40 family peptidase [Luteimonas fraxinea]